MGWMGWLLLTSSTAAVAAPAAEDPEGLIRQGVALRKLGENAKAQGYFQRAYDIARTPRSAAQLGLVEFALTQWGPAEIHLNEALGAVNDAWVQTNQNVLQTSLTEVRTHLGRLRVNGSPAGAHIRAGSIDRGTLPLPNVIYAPAGPLTVEAEAAGFQSARQTMTLATGEEKTLVINLVPLNRAAEAPAIAPDAPVVVTPPPAVEESVRWKRPAAWAAGGIAAALVAGGALALVASNNNYDDFNNELVPGSAMHRCNKAALNSGGADCPSLLSAGDRDKTLAIVGFAGAGALAVVSAILFATSSANGAGSTQALNCAPDPRLMVGADCLVRFW